LISAPKVFNEAGAQWVRKVVDRRNVFRINVHGDLAPKQPYLIALLLGFNQYVSIGVLVKDSVYLVNERALKIYLEAGITPPRGWSYATFHYGACARGTRDWEFDSRIIISFDDFLRGLYAGIEHQRKNGGLLETFFRMPGD